MNGFLKDLIRQTAKSGCLKGKKLYRQISVQSPPINMFDDMMYPRLLMPVKYGGNDILMCISSVGRYYTGGHQGICVSLVGGTDAEQAKLSKQFPPAYIEYYKIIEGIEGFDNFDTIMVTDCYGIADASFATIFLFDSKKD